MVAPDEASRPSLAQPPAEVLPSARRNIGAVLVERLLYVGATAAAFYITALSTSVETFGRFAAVVALVQLATSFGGMGLDGVLVHELSGSDERPGLISSARTIRFLGFGSGAILSLIAAVLLGWSAALVGAVAILAAAQLGQANFAFDAALQSDERFVRLAINRLTGNLLSNAALIAVALVSPSVALLVAARGLEPLVTGLLHRLSYRGRLPIVWLDSRARELVSRSWPVAVAAFFAVTYMRVDAIMLSVLSDDAAVAVYTLAARAAESFNFVNVALVTVLFARLIRVAPGGSVTAQARFLRRIVGAGVAVAPAAVLVGWLTPLLTGSEYDAVPKTAAVLALSIPGTFLLAGLAKLAISMHREMASLAVGGATAIVNLVANAVLIPAYGINGAAAATVVVSVVGPIAWAVMQSDMRAPLAGILAPHPRGHESLEQSEP